MRTLGRYILFDEIATGGMASIHFGRLQGAVGFSRTVAIKYLHPQFAKDPEFVAMFLDEARLAARVRHPNVVQTLDVVAIEGEIFLVMEYIPGETLSRLIRAMRAAKERVPAQIVSTIMSQALHGIHAAYEAKNEYNEPLHIVHRDISPQNILVGTDGVTRVLDFGVAKATSQAHTTTRAGTLKGKLAYMAPEQLYGVVSHQSDIYAAAIVLWEALTGERLFLGDSEAQTMTNVFQAHVTPPSELVSDVPKELDQIMARAFAREPQDRYPNAREFAVALEQCLGLATAVEVGAWVEQVAHDTLASRGDLMTKLERSSSMDVADVTSSPESAPHNSIVSVPTFTASASLPPWRRHLRKATMAGAAIASISGVMALLWPRATAQTQTTAQTQVSAQTPHPVVEVLDPAPSISASSTTVPTPLHGASVTSEDADADVSAHDHRRPQPQQPHPRTVAGTATAPAPTTPASATNCDPPYTIDATGRKIWRRECL